MWMCSLFKIIGVITIISRRKIKYGKISHQVYEQNPCDDSNTKQIESHILMWGRGSQKDVLNPQILIPVILPEDRVPICSREGIAIFSVMLNF